MQLPRVIAFLILVPAVTAFLSGPLLQAPGLRTASRNAALTICMGRKPATVDKGAGTTTREKVREKKMRDPAAPIEIKVKKITGVDVSRYSIMKKIEKATKENFAAELFNEKVSTFLTKEAGSSMYPRLMRHIKSAASRLGLEVPERFAYLARANAHSRERLAAKVAAAAAAAAEGAPADAAADGAAAAEAKA